MSFGANAVKSTVKIKEGGPTLFEGTVSSEEPKCEKGRDVTLYYSASGRQDDEAPVGEDRTDKDGNWSMDGEYFAGKYGADVSSKQKGDLSCKAAKSKRKRY